MRRRRFAGLLVVALLLGGAEAATGQESLPEGVGHAFGNTRAPVTVIEFSDFACSACALFWRTTWPRVVTELVESGRVLWFQVPFPLGFRRGDIAARAGECAADQAAFHAMHDRLFDDQQEWTTARRPEETFLGYAADLALDLGAFEVCYEKNHPKDRVRAAQRAAKDAGVRGTPTFFINGTPAVGALPFEAFLELVEEAERKVAERAAPVGERPAGAVTNPGP